MWDNALNIVEIGQKVIDSAVTKKGRADIYEDYKLGIKRQKTRDLYEFRSEKITLKLLEGEKELTKRKDLTMIDLGIGNTSDIVDGTIKTMSKKKLIEITFDSILCLTPKGQVNARKVKRRMENIESKQD